MMIQHAIKSARYGVIFAPHQGYNLLEELPKLRHMIPKTFNVAVLQVLDFESSFGGAMAHIIDLQTGEEVLFDRVYPYTVQGRVKACIPKRQKFSFN